MTQPSPWQWVALLYEGVTPPHGYAEFRLLDPHTDPGTNALVDRVWLEWPSPEPERPLWGKKKWSLGHVFLGVALRTAQGQQANSGTRADTHPTHLVWVDVDLKHTVYLDTPPEEASPEELRAAAAGCMADLLTLCEEHGLPPRAIVYSGHGLQLYWARRARSTFEDTEAFNRGLAKLLDGDPAATDQARILRVPGWVHHKNPDRPLPVELWHQDAQAWVEDTALEPHALRVQAYERSGDVFLNKGAVSDADLDVLQAAWHDVAGHTYDFKGNGRHQLALWTGGWLRTNGYAEADALELVHQLASTAADPALQDRLRAVRDAYRTENPKGWTGLTVDLGLPLGGIPIKEAPRPRITGANPEKTRTQVTPEPGEKPTLLQYALIFQAYNQEHAYEYAYHEQWQRWFEYQQGVYLEVPDTTLRKRLDLVMQEAGYTNLKKADLNEILLKVAHTPGIGKPRTDQGKWELNVTNGILDLESLDLAPHSSEYFSVVQAKAPWTPDSGCPDWAEFLTSAVPSREDRETLQRFCGYALTGDTSAQKALLLIGEGGTGKSTFVRVVSAVLGGFTPYSLATSSALENIRDGSFIVGNLVGKRMCVISELEQNVNWLPFKRVTGEDAISIDVKNKDAYITKLDTKLIILSNVIPKLGEDASNSSLTRRFLPIAFNVKPTSPDPGLEARLTRAENLSGILTWMVKGLQALLADGMRFPNTGLNDLGREIVEESNKCIDFLRERCAPGGEARGADLYETYQAWCYKTGRAPSGNNRFARDLIAAATYFNQEVTKRPTRTGAIWSGLRLSEILGGWDVDL